MITPFVTAIASRIGAHGFGAWGTNLFGQSMPENPVVCTVVEAVGGPVLPGEPVGRRMFVVRHRRPASAAVAALTFVGSLHTLFDDVWNVLDTDHLGRIYPLVQPGQFVYDERGNVLYELSYVWVGVQ